MAKHTNKIMRLLNKDHDVGKHIHLITQTLILQSKVMFTNLKYSDTLIKSIISHFVTSVRSENPEVQAQSTNENAVHRVILPFKDQKS